MAVENVSSVVATQISEMNLLSRDVTALRTDSTECTLELDRRVGAIETKLNSLEAGFDWKAVIEELGVLGNTVNQLATQLNAISKCDSDSGSCIARLPECSAKALADAAKSKGLLIDWPGDHGEQVDTKGFQKQCED